MAHRILAAILVDAALGGSNESVSLDATGSDEAIVSSNSNDPSPAELDTTSSLVEVKQNVSSGSTDDIFTNIESSASVGSTEVSKSASSSSREDADDLIETALAQADAEVDSVNENGQPESTLSEMAETLDVQDRSQSASSGSAETNQITDGQPYPDATGTAESCELLGEVGSFGWWLQIMLAVASFASLLYKRFTDRVPRPWNIWRLDVAKQAVGAAVIHFTNILLGMLFGAVMTSEVDPCDWYWVIFVVDCTIGLVVIFVILKILFWLYNNVWLKPELARSGDYGDPPDIKIWRRQLIDYQIVVMISKVVMLVVILIFASFFEVVSGWILSPLKSYPKVKLVFVMVITPLIMSIFFFWVMDNVLKQGDDDIEGAIPADIELEDAFPPSGSQPQSRQSSGRRIGSAVGKRRNNFGDDVPLGDSASQDIGLESFADWRNRTQTPPAHDDSSRQLSSSSLRRTNGTPTNV